MSYGLGIDTGGTYTDAVIYDFDSKSIIGISKSITIKENLVKCISKTLDGLPEELLKRVNAVSLSTTLATNACIEGKGGRAKLILIGCDKKVAASYGAEYGLPPVKDIIFLNGGHDQKGNIVCEPDWTYLKNKISGFVNSVDSFAVVEIWGMNNCDYEKHAKKVILEWTGKKVVCGHELTAKINLLKRAASTLLNAQLIPLIGEFITAIKKSLKHRGINAPIAIVRGDGSLMSEDFAMDKPVETLLCGPAASVAGGINLTDEKNCVIVDMGGTTSDTAIVRNSMPKLADEGAVVGKWRTGTHSILIETIGLGGDSRISFNNDNTIKIGPERVVPLSWAASKWPVITNKIKRIYNGKKKYFFPLCEFYYLIKDISGDEFYNHIEKAIADSLKNGPVGVVELSGKLNLSLISTETSRLERHGVISKIGLTPTDLMHIEGDFNEWNDEAALLGAKAMAFQINTDLNSLISNTYEIVKEKLFLTIAKTLIEDEDKSLLKEGLSGQLKEVLLNGFRKARQTREGRPIESHSFFSNLTTSFAIIGIGAPAHVYLKDVADAMGTKCIIPENAKVANAIGAITGSIRTEKQIIVNPNYSPYGITGYNVFSGNDKAEFKDYEKALDWARQQASDAARKSAVSKGAKNIAVSLSMMENEASIASVFEIKDSINVNKKPSGDCIGNKEDCGQKGNKILIETIITATAVGKPMWSK